LGATLNWRRDPGYELRMLQFEQRKMQHELRMRQLGSEIEQIEKETEQLRRENARQKALRVCRKTSSQASFPQP
jgi:hypothetical protein